jgi:putative drug exporter of the RND superfamily
VKALSSLAVRRPRATLAIWLMMIAGLGFAGLKVEQELHLTKPFVPGSTSAHEQERVSHLFGEESTLVALLDGPQAKLKVSGPEIVDALSRLPHVSVVSPWIPDPPKALHPDPRDALLLIGVDAPYEQVGKKTVPAIRSTLNRLSPRSVEHHLSGYPDLAAAVERETFAALKQAELIAAALLFILLLFVFRGPVAAAVPLFLGISSVVGTRGLLVGLNALSPLDAAALSLASMFGLALGVDYSLLLVSRFREQLQGGEGVDEAALSASATAGRTVVVAGCALGASMTAAYFVAPNHVLSSGSIGGLCAVGMSLIGTMLALPALLSLLGSRINLWQFGRREPGNGLATLAWRLIRRPLVCSGLVTVVLLALAAHALTIKVGPPNEASLPSSSAEVRDLKAMGTRLGGGWTTPYEVIIRARKGLVTDPRILSAMAAWEARLEGERSVAGVIGPQEVYGGQGPPSTRDSFSSEAEIELELLREAPPEQRGAVNMAVNTHRGGTALRMVVVERTGSAPTLAADPATKPGDPLRQALTEQARGLEAQTRTQISVGGPAAVLQDFTTSSQHSLPKLILVLSLVTFLMLLIVMRSVPMALAAVALNVLTVGSTLGILVLVFQDGGLLGVEPGQLDGVITPAVISVAFGLAIDYEVFLLARLREGYAISNDIDESLRYALKRTAPVITGAALIMCGVFVAFASTRLANLREYGVGLTVAVLLDATIVRLVLLPTVIRMLARRAWWIPGWLDRLILRWHLEGA